MDTRYDVIVVGAGPAGYVAAIRCAQLGLKTACVDSWKNNKGGPALGGTCLNVGCIPSKALLESTELYERINHDSADHGINIKSAEIDVAKMMARKDKIVSNLTQGVAALFKSNGITLLSGRGKLLENKTVEVCDFEGNIRTITANNIILAVGSVPADIKQARLVDGFIYDSSGALAFESVPKRLGIIGAGVIGLELGSVWKRLGSEVVLLEAQSDFLPMADAQVAKDARRYFSGQELDIRLGARVKSANVKAKKVVVEYQDGKGEHQEKFDKLIVAVGRRPNTDGLFSDESGLLLDGWGFVHVDDNCRSNVPGVFAIGDIVRGPMLAHKGSEEGMMVAEIIAGQSAEVNYELIPSVVYTRPEIAWVGKTEQQLKTEGVAYNSGVFPLLASGRAQANGDTQGMVKILSDTNTDRVLGVHMIGMHSSELISQAVIAMEFGASSEDLALTIFAHPSLSEAFHEAALDVSGRAIHMGKKRKLKK